jgi:ribosome-associated toxin RatA of RatAB toxin-antitoxin module
MLNRLFQLLLLGCALAAWGTAPAAAQTGVPSFELNVERVDGAGDGRVYRIASNGTVAAAPDVVWRILTDYKRLADYVPDLKSARVVSRSGDKVIVEQVGAARFLFFSQAIRLLVQVHEQAPNRIDISLIDGDLKIYRASWELSALAGTGGTRVVYKAAIAPKFYVPALIGESVVKQDIARMMAAVLLRLDRPE